MIVSLIILGALLLVGSILYAFHRRDLRRGEALAPTLPPVSDPPPATNAADEEVCCGMHMTCERDSLIAEVSREIEYFDDEELDAFAGRKADSYTAEEADQFREVLLTLLPDDIAPWARSIQLRGIELPGEVREELLMIVAEERAKRATAENN